MSVQCNCNTTVPMEIYISYFCDVDVFTFVMISWLFFADIIRKVAECVISMLCVCGVLTKQLDDLHVVILSIHGTKKDS